MDQSFSPQHDWYPEQVVCYVVLLYAYRLFADPSSLYPLDDSSAYRIAGLQPKVSWDMLGGLWGRFTLNSTINFEHDVDFDLFRLRIGGPLLKEV